VLFSLSWAEADLKSDYFLFKERSAQCISVYDTGPGCLFGGFVCFLDFQLILNICNMHSQILPNI